MHQAFGQAIPLQQTRSAQLYDGPHTEESQTLQCPPQKHWLQCTVEDHFLKPKTRRGQILCWIFWLLAVAAGCVLFWQVLPRFVDHVVKPTIKYIERHFTKVQVAGIALAAMSVFPVVFISSTPIMLLVSAVLGFWWGFLVTTIGTSIGMLLSFLVGKQIFRDRLHGWVAGNPKAEAMLLAISEAGTFKVIVLMRQVVPYTWLNYAASASPEITLSWYMLASVIGQVPHNAVDVYLGGNVTGLGDLLAGKPANTATIVTYTLGFTAAALVAGLAYFYAKRALRKIEQQAQQQDAITPQPFLQDSAGNARPKAISDEAALDALNSDETGQPMLLQQQHRSDLDEAVESPTTSDGDSPSQHRLLHPGCEVTAEIESSPV
ncbi:hypothetical protein WJX77_001389 [Trebouxia sp. C0004]